jgi:hypothetical protein
MCSTLGHTSAVGSQTEGGPDLTGVADLQLGYHNLGANEQGYQKTAMSAPMVSPFRACCPGYGPSSFAISSKGIDIGLS